MGHPLLKKAILHLKRANGRFILQGTVRIQHERIRLVLGSFLEMLKLRLAHQKVGLDTSLLNRVQLRLSNIFLHIYLYSLTAWNENPTITIIETISYPIEKVTFPTVTICPQNSNPDRWGPTIKIFDHFQRHCSTYKYASSLTILQSLS